jgi:hypothetical protein
MIVLNGLVVVMHKGNEIHRLKFLITVMANIATIVV